MIILTNEEGYVVFQTEQPTQEQIDEGFEVELIPTPELTQRKTAHLKYDSTTRELYYVYLDRPASLEEQIHDFKETSISAVDRLAEMADQNISLEEMQTLKLNALKEQCSAAIYDGFTSGANEFGFNLLDQSNFTQRMVTIVSGAPGPFKWKTKNNGVVELTKDEFIQAVMDAEAHKLVQQEKYWSLEIEVLAAISNDEVNAVIW